MEKIDVQILPAISAHAQYIGENVRPEDAEELWASSFSKAGEVIEKGLRYSDVAYAGIINGVPVCVWGVVKESLISDDGIPWMVGSNELNNDDVAKTFLRLCREPIMVMLENYDRLENYVDARNIRSQRWLRYMGFTIEKEPIPYGVLQMPFYKFWMVKENQDV